MRHTRVAWGRHSKTRKHSASAKALGHSHATCRSGLAINNNFICNVYQSHGKEDTLSPVRSKMEQ